MNSVGAVNADRFCCLARESAVRAAGHLMTTYADDGLVAGSHLLGLLARLDCAGGLASMAFLSGSFTAAPTSIGDLDPLSVRLAPA